MDEGAGKIGRAGGTDRNRGRGGRVLEWGDGVFIRDLQSAFKDSILDGAQEKKVEAPQIRRVGFVYSVRILTESRMNAGNALYYPMLWIS